MRGRRQVPVSEWTACGASPLAAGTLIRLRDDGYADTSDDGLTLTVSWAGIAGIKPEQLRSVGLPDAAPFEFEIGANGAIHDADFSLRYGFKSDGRSVMGVQREGAWLRVGRKSFVLPDPLYSIAGAIDRFNSADHRDLESRMLEWGQIAKMLPEDVAIDRRLSSLNVVVASKFQLDPFLNRSGEPDFDPVIGSTETLSTESPDPQQQFVGSLPKGGQATFASRFRTLPRVKHRYTLPGRDYVVLTPEVERALAAVRRAQDGTPVERRAFLENVSGYLRAALEQTGEDEFDVDRVFSDHGLSDRVRNIGLWTEKALPWIEIPPQAWLPPVDLGLRIGSRVVSLVAEDLYDLREKVETAIERGDPVVQTLGGEELPANRSTLDSLDVLIRRMDPTQHPTEGGEGPGEVSNGTGPEGSDRVLIVIDNLEAVQFQGERRRRAPRVVFTKSDLRSNLFPHQEQCLSWLLAHWNSGSCGALLADDMGLGKTLEALAFLKCLKQRPRAEQFNLQPMLVVAPTGLLRNWLDEHDKHLSGRGIGKAVEAHGTQLRGLRIDKRSAGNEVSSDQSLPKLNIEALRQADWVLTTYETLRDYQHSFGRVRWRVAVFDEAQKIKNPSVRITDAALAMNVEFALLMTGTPVENRVADIWAIGDRAEPGIFGTLKEFSKQFESRQGGGEQNLQELREKLLSTSPGPPLMMRRLKEDYLPNLPRKITHKYIVDMPQLQADLYEDVVLYRRHTQSMLKTLHQLRSISLHPELAEGQESDQYIQNSARLAQSFRTLDQIATKGEKALLFVESLQMQDFLIGEIRRRFRLPDDVLVVNGTVSGHVRKARVDMFQARVGFDVMILSPRAGGVGLTLTAANHVIHLSRWWNPAVEDQCTDRVLRIGQNRPVHVYLPIARHPRFGDFSFDLKLHELIERKRRVNRRVLAPTAATDADVRALFRSTTTDACGALDTQAIRGGDQRRLAGAERV